MKRALFISLVLLLCLLPAGVASSAPSSGVAVMVEGEAVRFDQPPVVIDARTLVPVRAVLERIGAEVSWDAQAQTIAVTKGSLELVLGIGSQSMTVSGRPDVELDVPPQIIGGRTLLPIRAVVEQLGYEVEWDAASRSVMIELRGTVMVSRLGNTQASGVSNWASISPVQQFMYMGEGLAYAYIRDGMLVIATPLRTLEIEMRHPRLGDVIADADGNIYIVWGRENSTSFTSVETVFISKYSPTGSHIATTGFTGGSSGGSNSNTRTPFSYGNCASAIANGYLMVNYSRSMYNGHQSNNVIGVRVQDMSPAGITVPQTSHSFNQSVIWSDIADDFVYADHGDAYGRGFTVTSGGRRMLLFHFYLEANANYNMYIVNRTFAQQGGLAETSMGVALVGASARSISEAAKNERQNLFVQIFDPRAREVSPSMFVGGQSRSGATSTDINDNNNAPLTSVTDYGVHWLTNYTDTDVIAPQVVAAGDRLVILWATANDTYYMVLSANGTVITPATSLGAMPLNSHEPPVYHNGAVYWASVRNGRLNIRSIEV